MPGRNHEKFSAPLRPFQSSEVVSGAETFYPEPDWSNRGILLGAGAVKSIPQPTHKLVVLGGGSERSAATTAVGRLVRYNAKILRYQ